MKISTTKFQSVLILLIFLFGFSISSDAQCEIGAIEATPTPCDESCHFNLFIDFEYVNVGSMGFTVEGNGGIYGSFEYSDLPIMLNDLECDGTTDYEFVVRDIEFPDCSNLYELGIVYCEGGPCNIWNVDVFPQPCEAGFFHVHITFWHEGIGTQGFRVQGNGNNYGNFEYDALPIIIGPLEGDGITEYEFVVIDNEFEDCSDWAAIDPIECPGGDCNIWDMVVDDHPCDTNGIFYTYLNFEYENVSQAGFRLYVNNVWYDDFTYDQLPLWEVGPLAGDGTTEYHFMVVDLENEDCAEDISLGPIDCGASSGCNIWDTYADILPCDEEGHFNVVLDFEFMHIGWYGFRVQGNGVNYGSFEYDDIPLLIGPLLGDGSTIYEFVVTDNEFEDCSDWTAIDPVNCMGGNCEIGDIEVCILPCNENDEFNVLIDFGYANTSDQFNIHGNGINYGTFLYTNLPIELGPFQGDGTTVYEFGIVDVVHDNCGNSTAIDPVSCDGETAFINFTTQVISCEADMYELQMDFDVINGGDQGFMVMGNGEVYGYYEYAQLPITIGPLSTDGSTPYHFIAKDKQFLNYGNWDKLIPFTCESLGVKGINISAELVKVYPNPSYGSVSFENLQKEVLDVIIYNSAGAETRSFFLTKTYKLHDLESGIYYYRIVGTEGQISSGKLIVTK